MPARLRSSNRTSKFKVWTTLRLSTAFTTGDEFRSALSSAGMRLGDWANDILDKIPLAAGDTELEMELVRITIGEIGFKQSTCRSKIVARAVEIGLILCPSAVGPQLRLRYTNQPKDEWLIIGMEPISAPDGAPRVFSVGHGRGELWLSGDYGHPDYIWDTDHSFVFVRR